ncbi:MAG: FAD-dependent oxidoreductase [Pseudomonadota bacterium]
MAKQNNTSRKKVLIIGAGIAGLAACKQLLEYGFDAKILEAQDRVGGRILTDTRFGISLGLGASFIHGDKDNPITTLAEKYGAKRVAVNPDKFIFLDHNGKFIPQSIINEFNIKFSTLLEQAKEFALSSSTDVALSVSMLPFIDKIPFSSIEKELLKTRLLALEGYLGASCSSLSGRYWDEEQTWPGDNCLLINSYQPIINGLEKDCPVQLKSNVKKINIVNENIEVTTEHEIFNSDAVIITVPLGVLKRNQISINPSLPRQKIEAVQRLGMGLFNITAIKFATSFWPKDSHAIFLPKYDDLDIPVFLNLYQFTKEPLLIGHSGGNSAFELEKFSNTELQERIMAGFKRIFGDNIPTPENFITTRWSQNEFSHGSYSYLPPKAHMGDYGILAEPFMNKIFFAGEATHSQFPATTHGAYLSGIREAERIKDLLL